MATADKSSAIPEKRFQGVGVSPGIVRATVVVQNHEDEEVPDYAVRPEEIPGEIARFESALVATRTQILEMQQRIAESVGSGNAGIFDAHLLVVEDRTVIDEVLRLLEKEQKNIESVFHQVASRYIATLEALDDPYLKERALDIHDVSRRVLRNLSGKSPRTITLSSEPHILVARNLTPSDTAVMNCDLVLGFATDVGSKTSHTAIMANSLNIPAVVGLHTATQDLETGDPVLLDGYNGMLIVHPSEQTLYEYGQIESRRGRVEQELETLRDTRSATRDGSHIILSANIELPGDLESVQSSGAEGIGLYRTEFFFLNRPDAPSEDEQFENYRTIAEACKPHGVIIRTLDVGGDKLSSNLGTATEENPFLGWRAIRFCLERMDIFKPQLRAILRASACGNVRIMFPMISGIEEWRAAVRVLEECREELRAEGRSFDPAMEVGAMIEIPSAAIASDSLAREASFFSIGTNDLIQYTIAVDRMNDRITNLYQPTHPAIVRLIRMVVDSARRHGRWVGVCGEMAGDVLYTPLLLGLGVDELSAGAALVPRVKRAVQALDMFACRTLAEEVCGIETHAEIAARCETMARAHYPELLA